MLSNKWTFSLTSLVVMLALAFVVPSAMAAEFTVGLSVDTDDDISSAGEIQVVYGTAATEIKIDTGAVVQLATTASVVVGTVTARAGARAATTLELLDFEVIAYNSFGGTVSPVPELTLGTVPGVTPVTGVPTPVTAADGKSFVMNLAGFNAPTPDQPLGAGDITRVLIYIPKHAVEVADPRANLDAGVRTADGKSAEASLTINYVRADPEGEVGDPTVYSIRRASDPLLPVTAATENVIILLSEQPKAFTKDNVDVTNATWVDPVALVAVPEVDPGMLSTGRDNKLYPYVLTITPTYPVDKPDIVVKVKAFEDMVLPAAATNKYDVPAREADYDEGIEKLTIKVGIVDLDDKLDGLRVALPEKIIISSAGYLVAAPDDGAGDDNHAGRTDSTQIVYPGDPTKDPASAAEALVREPHKQTYNLIRAGLPNLETFLANGGVIDVVSPHALVISEVMWGTDASLGNPAHNQWIELYNAGAAYTTVVEDAATDALEATYLVFYRPNETPPAMTPAVPATATTAAVEAKLPAGVSDRVGTITAAGAYWSIAGKGQNGRSGQGESTVELLAVAPTHPIISMYRVTDATTGTLAIDGRAAASWSASGDAATGLGINFDVTKVGRRIGTPGIGHFQTPAAIAAAEAAAKAVADAKAKADADAAAKAADTSVSMPLVGQIYISEVMFAGGGTLPQWIEISNGSRSEQVNLSDWTLTVENATADADVSVGSKAVFTIPEGTRIDPSGQHDTTSTILVVTEQGRHNLDAGTGTMGEDQILNLWTAQQTELILLGVTKRRYSLLSDMAFKVTLAPPTPIVAPAAATPAPTTAAGIAAARAAAAAKAAADATAAKERADATDVVGNLGTAGTATWALPMDEGARSSIIRRHVPVSIGAAAPEAGEMMDSWALASDTSFAQITHIRASSYYGSADDVGTPGFRAGGALPVELSHFRPARNKDTGAVVITWSTQSELNNAGFFIKRSQQRDGEFQIINATMIQGAGTTSEKQSYTYEDTTAQPNVVYYYQIEDVSLDGNHQTLTRGIRLKGHIGAAGKATVLWGDLKTQE